MALCSGQRPPRSLPFIPKVTTTNIIIITITTIMIIIIVTNPVEWAMIICRRQCLIVAIDLDLGLGLQALNRADIQIQSPGIQHKYTNDAQENIYKIQPQVGHYSFT